MREGVAALLARTGADELMATANIFDHGLRKRSFTILAEAHNAALPAAS